MAPRRLYSIAWLALALAAGAADLKADVQPPFDHYVLALSWSPTYCSSSAGGSDGTQCGSSKRFAFVVHGLWPQYRVGWPEFCMAREKFVSEEQIAGMLPIMPSPRLVVHQWRKHGTCSGLSMAGYFTLTRSLFASVRIPARYLSPTAPIDTTAGEIASDFVKSNRGLDSSMISVSCRGGSDRARLSEVAICFSAAGRFTPCGVNERRRCKASGLVLPPARPQAAAGDEIAN